MTHCAKCGACTAVCPVYKVTGRESLTARGKLHLLERLPTKKCSAAYADIISKCLLCGACESVCSRGINILPRIVEARRDLPLFTGDHPFLARLAEKALNTPSLVAACSSLGTNIAHLLPKDSGLRLRLGLSSETYPDPAQNKNQTTSPEQATVAYFSGCLARYPQPEISHATQKLVLKSTGSKPFIPMNQGCCGQAAYSNGNNNDAKQLAKQNITAFADNDLPILTSCASCYSHLSSYPDLLQDEEEWATPAIDFAARLREFSSFFVDSTQLSKELQAINAESPPETVFYHDPCHLRFKHQITNQPRQLLTEAGFILRELPFGPQCCGMGGLFHLNQPELSEKIRNRLLTKLGQPSPDFVTTTCSGCLLQLRLGLHQQKQTPTVKHLAVLLAEKIKT
ncbi:MAG: (Fe-S)-binding protein [Desulfobulbaceae bacterium]|nr:(Fe-S)-binding protein [Desulfobulbaceae bacterium]